MKNLNLICPLSLVILSCAVHAPANLLGMEKEIDLKHTLNELDKMSKARANAFYEKEYPFSDKPDYKKVTSSLLDKMQQWFSDNSAIEIDLNMQSENGNTLLRFVVDEVASKIKDNGDKYLKTAYPEKMVEFLHYLLAHNADPNIQNKNGQTPFFHCMWDCLVRYPEHKASMHSDATQVHLNNLIDLLLKYNANPDVASTNSDVLTLLAHRQYCKEMQEILNRMTTIKDIINKPDNKNELPACVAACVLNLELLRIFHEAGADFNIANKKKQTPLQYALDCKGDFMEDIIGTEITDAVINFLQEHTQTNQ